jgi:hypothetical protein
LKRRLFGWIAVLIGIVLSLGAVELMAIAWLMIEDGKYTPAVELFQRTQNTFVRDMTRGVNCRYVDTLYPHPYLAFVHHANPPCGLKNLNNIGLLNDDYPTVKREDRFTILLTGGSIASQLAQMDPRPAPRFLELELNDNYVSPNGRPFFVLSGGDGAWKQPQPFILFMLHAQAVDGVVTIGGLNEFYMFRNYVTERLERPVSNFLEVNPLVSDENFGDASVGWVMGRIAGALSLNPVLGQSHAVYMIVRGVEALAKGRGGLKSKKRTTIDSIFALPVDMKGDGERIFEFQLSLYRKYQRAMEAVARDNDVKAAFFFHAVPAWGKTLTDEEKAVAGDLSYAPLYRRMVEGMLTQNSQGLAVFDLGNLFVDMKESIYADDAHFRFTADHDSKGYRLMAKRMAADLAQAWGLKRKAP